MKESKTLEEKDCPENEKELEEILKELDEAGKYLFPDQGSYSTVKELILKAFKAGRMNYARELAKELSKRKPSPLV